METVEINKYHLNKLKLLETSRFVTMTEGKIFLYPEKNQWETEMKVIKSFFLTPSQNKIDVVSTLDENRYSLMRYKELVLPEKIITSGGEPYGITLRFIEGDNFSDYLMNKDIPYSEKIKRFREIGNFLSVMGEFRKYDRPLSNFYLGDIHSSNFLVSNGKMKIVDLDSCTIGLANPSISKYLSQNFKLERYGSKYKFLDADKTLMIPTDNTELYSYTMMFLSYLAGLNVSKLSEEDYFSYITYLNSIGVDDEMCRIFRRIYTNRENADFHELLDESNDITDKSSFNEFVRNRKLY
ncbi:MAG: hypothetical protein K6G37_02465 [Bacilli bacterium]|nr:hypothetical protein [Bacilli bacterium]